MDGKEFLKTKEALVAKQKGLNKEGKGNKPNAARMLTDEEVDILYGQDLSRLLFIRGLLLLYG